MTIFFNLTRRLRRDEGQDLIEYALLKALIAIVATAGVTAVGTAVFTSFWAVIAAGLQVP